MSTVENLLSSVFDTESNSDKPRYMWINDLGTIRVDPDGSVKVERDDGSYTPITSSERMFVSIMFDKKDRE